MLPHVFKEMDMVRVAVAIARMTAINFCWILLTSGSSGGTKRRPLHADVAQLLKR